MMKANITDEELLQEVQKLASELSLAKRQHILELMLRYKALYSIVQSVIPNYPNGVLDAITHNAINPERTH
ncbi:hypothetical protein AWS52_07205 [Enterobacter cloacae subsp. cloacae]|uniref:Uncharacterized protein n=2 Tax=Leclercia barmai TaxID=2785629 RepID=A0ABS7S1I3_9ENTR|nr:MULTISPECIES: hypothetical protein [Enterobacteriaceae]KVI48558.1 hypothetical protein AWS52_07205 [Enterobacter cloacae subsp. cloacae]MBZ0060142.1 hypothetical protein [Leclercia sp. EMC7]MCM5698113.1 hypothetical protein [Leclercia sp. LTM01]MCM5702607.1 hypothetical protein [Leclercia sp. LTM14]